MAKLPGQTFDSSQYDDMNDFTPLPAGKYPAHIVNSDIKTTLSGTGKYIKLEIEVLSGDFKGRKIFNNLNIENPSKEAVEIAQRELATLCRATGVLNLTDTNQLHNIPFMITVKIQPAKGDYPPQNAVTGYASFRGLGQPEQAIKNKQSRWKKPAFLQNKEEKTFDNPNGEILVEDDIPF